MPSKHIDDAAEQPCRRCKDKVSVISVRSEPLCHECFIRYVHTKSIKRLESFRVRFATADQQRRLLLPLSFGVSSTVLLHILDHHLETQRIKTGRTGFALSVVCIESPDASYSMEHLLSQLRERYPDHQYASLPLHDIFRLIPEDDTLRDLIPKAETNNDLSSQEKLANLINSLTSTTARADVMTTLRTRLIVEHAKLSSCESILWGDNCTRLAEKTLSETAKGRGFSLTWQVADGESPFGIQFHYPMRDVLKKELVSYVNVVEPDLENLIQDFHSGATQASMSSKNTTIDDLMKQYFESLEENFPSIVSNVVRTTGKLQLPSGTATEPQCSLCSMPVPGGRFGIHGWGGDQQDSELLRTGGKSTLCFGCTRSVPR